MYTSDAPFCCWSIYRCPTKAQRCAEPPQFLQAATVGREGAGTGSKQRKGHQQSLQSAKHEAELVARASEAAAKRAAAVKAAQEGFEAKLSLLMVMSYLLLECVQPLAGGKCPVCEKRLLPAEPGKLSKVRGNGKGGWQVLMGCKGVSFYC